MTSTRRDALKMTVGAALAAIGMKPLTMTASAPAESFDVDKYHNAWLLMTVAGGVDVSRDMDLADAMWNHFYGEKPLPAEYEPARQ